MFTHTTIENSKSTNPHGKTLSPSRKRFVLWTVLALAVAVLTTVVVLNATANPPNAAEIRVQGLVRELEQDRLTAARHNAQRELEALGEQAVPALMVALRSDNPVLRRNAADMLGFIASNSAVGSLQYALANDTVPSVRRNAAYALGEIEGFSQVTELKRAALLDTNALVRQTAQDSLARMQTRIALSAGVNEQRLDAYAVAPQSTNNVYAATGRDLKVTNDGGTTWETLKGTLPSMVNVLAVSPGNERTLYAGVDSLGMFKSMNGGRSWEAINNGLDIVPGARTVISAITVDPTDSQRVLIATGVMLGTSNVEFIPTGILSSTDGGTTWNMMREYKQGDALTQLLLKGSQVYALAGSKVMIYRFN
jgi:hypothetical protein